jgi:hypothetical protein
MDEQRLRRLCLFAGGCVLFFLATQLFQAIAYWVWLPEAQTASQELLQRTLALDRARALFVMFGIVALLGAYVVLALLRFRAAPAASILGVIFGALFVSAELFYRSLDFFVVSLHWAADYRLSELSRDLLLQRYELWSQMVQAWYFPLQLSHMLAAICFLIATWRVFGRWAWLAPAAFGLNSIRLVARTLNSFAGQHWLAAFNRLPLYFATVALVNGMLAAWFFWMSRDPAR